MDKINKINKSNNFEKNTFNNRFCWLNDVMGPSFTKIFLVIVIVFIIIFILLSIYGNPVDKDIYDSYTSISNNISDEFKKNTSFYLVLAFLISILSLSFFFSFFKITKTIFKDTKLLGLIVFICIMIYIFNEFTNNDLKSNASYLFPFVLIIGCALLYFNIYNTIDYTDLVTKLSYNSNLMLEKQISGIIIYICLCVFLFTLYNSSIGKYALDSYNELFGTHLKINMGIIIMFLIFILIFGFIFLVLNLLESNKSLGSLQKFFDKSVLIYSFGAIVSILMFAWIINTIVSYSNTGSGVANFVINAFFIVIILGVMFKLLTSTNFYNKSPALRLIINSIFYIPCLFYSIFDVVYNFFLKLFKSKSFSGAITSQSIQNEATKSNLILLIIVVIMYLIYFVFYPYYMYMNQLQNGLLLINLPISIRDKTTIASYQTLQGTEEFDYQYGLSFWLYLDSENPSINIASQKYTSVINYGDKFHLEYNVKLNKMRLVTKNNGNKNNILDENGNTILFEKPDILLQKWNHIIINYDSGALDIFYNGLLEKSKLQIIPFMEYDTLDVGSDKGIFGRVCNVNYFKTPLTISQINHLYNSVKDKTPPVISHINKTIMNIGEYTIKPISSFNVSDPDYSPNLPSTQDEKVPEQKLDPTNITDFNPDYLSLKWYFAANKDNQTV